MIEIRHLCEKDADALWHLRATAFSMPLPPKAPSWIIDNSIGVFDDGRLSAAVFTKPLSINWCGTYMPMYGIGGVSTLPLSRRGGFIRSLFGEIEKRSVEDGTVIGMLYPFSYVYYRQFGYERLSPRVSVTLPLASMDDFPRNSDGELYDGSQADALLALYNRYADMMNLMTRRSSEKDFPSDSDMSLKYTYLHKTAGEFDAYATVQYTPENITVTEIAYTTPDSLHGMIGMLRMFEGQRKTIVFAGLPQTSPILSLLSRYKECQYSVSNGAMGRIFDVETFLRANKYPETEGRFVLGVHDSGARCGGIYSVEYGKGAADIRKVEGVTPDVETDGANLARILMSGTGYSADELAFLPKTAVNNRAGAEALSLAFPRCMTDHLAHY